MKALKYIGLLLVLLSMLVWLVVPILPVSATSYSYMQTITITDNSTTNRVNVPVLLSGISPSYLVLAGDINSNGTDTSMSNNSTGSTANYMMDTTQPTLVIPSLPAYGSVSYNFYMGASSNQTGFPIISGIGGYVTTPDDPVLEMGSAFSSVFQGLIDTTAGANKYLVHKPYAFRTFVSDTVSGNVASQILTYAVSGTWVSPTSGSGTSWTNISNAYDGNTATYAAQTSVSGWNPYLYLVNTSIFTSQIRFWPDRGSAQIDQAEVDVYYEGGWHNVFIAGAPTWNNWNTANLGGLHDVSQVRARFHDSVGPGNESRMHEIAINQPDESPSATVSATGVSSGVHIVTIAKNSPFFGMGVDSSSFALPVTANLTLNAPFWQTELDTSPFTTIDSNALTATVTGATWGSQGRIFDGNDYITITDAPVLRNFTSFAYGIWFKTSTDYSGGEGMLMAKYGGDASIYLKVATNNKVTFGARDNDGVDLADCNSPNTVNDGVWHYAVVGHLAGTSHVLYLDGVLQSTMSAGVGTASFSEATNDMRIGARSYSTPASYFTGTIGQTEIYDRALTPTEVMQNYNATKSKYTSGDIYTCSTLLGVPDNTSNWVIGQNIPSITSYTETVGVTEVIKYQPASMLSGTTVTNLDSGGSYPGTIVWGANSGVSISYSSLIQAPTLYTSGTAAIGSIDAYLMGTIVSFANYNYATVYFQYGSTTSYGSITGQSQVTSLGAFTIDATPLYPSYTYHYRAVASFGSGTSVITIYGSDLTFTTVATVGSSTDLVVRNGGVFKSYISANDLLFTAEVTNKYTNLYPGKSAGRYFTVQLVSTDNFTILAATPLANWGDRPIAIYVNPTQAATLTQQAQYYIRVQGDITSSNATMQYQLQPVDWRGSNLWNLDEWCRGITSNMATSDGVDRGVYLTSVTGQGYVITDAAGAFFTTGIPGIDTVRPYLFTTSQKQNTINAGGSSNAWDKPDLDPAGWRAYVGSKIVSDMAKIVYPFGISGKDGASIIIFAVVIGFMFTATAQNSGQGALGFGIMTVPLIWLGTYFRILPFMFLIIILLACGALAIRQFIVKTT